jgi:hypothetical protein
VRAGVNTLMAVQVGLPMNAKRCVYALAQLGELGAHIKCEGDEVKPESGDSMVACPLTSLVSHIVFATARVPGWASAWDECLCGTVYSSRHDSQASDCAAATLGVTR